MQPAEQHGMQRICLCAGLAVLGVSLIAVSFYVGRETSEILIGDVTQIIMIVSGSACIVLSVIVYFVKSSYDP